MKLYASRAEDRDSLCVILCRNGYTVRQGTGKRCQTDKKKLSYVEVIECGTGKAPSAGGDQVVNAADDPEEMA